MHGRHVYKGIAGSVLHTFALLSGMRAALFRLCYARSMPMLFAPRSASRLWVCCSHCRGPLRVHGYAFRAAVRFAFVGMLLALPQSASRSWVCCSHYRLTSRSWACRSYCRGPFHVREYAACIAGSLRVRRDRGDAVSLTLRLCLPRVLPVSTLRDV